MKKYEIISDSDFELGSTADKDSISVCAVSDSDKPLSLELYDRKSLKRIHSVRFPNENHIGAVYSMTLKGLDPSGLLYRLRSGRREYLDPYAKEIAGNRRFGKRDGFGGFIDPVPAIGHEGDRLEWEDLVIYLLNVRAFTKDPSSKVKHPGTFDGLKEKIPYLKKLGITSLLLQPCYDFNEVSDKEQTSRINLWGYVPGNYFYPKPSYAFGDPVEEFASLLDELHKNKMELYMQFYFMSGESTCFIQRVLRYWAEHYRVDGFELMGADLPVKEIALDPYLRDMKLLFTQLDVDMIYGRSEPKVKNLGFINDPFMYDMRKYLKGDEDMLNTVSKHILANPGRMAMVNHITSYYGFTLKDLVSYERKHNEKNGEMGADGSDYNYSWNCGDEGTSRKKAVNSLRLRQMKNAVILLALSQGVPMLRFGDEFGNSQRGNNNAWCQDNKISYLDWNDLEKNKDLFEFTKKVIALRKKHPVFRSRYAKKMYDYISCGAPDASFHGEQAWNQSFVNYNRHFALMYSGAYEKVSDKSNDDDFYIAYNMHWTGHRFHPPKPAKGKKWEICLSTGSGKEAAIYDQTGNELAVSARSIVVLRAV